MAEILLLDDDADARKLGKELLESKTETEVDTASSVTEVGEFDYELVISDYSGIDVEPLYDEADNLVLFTGFQEQKIDMPEDVEHIRKGSGYDEVIDRAEDYIHN